MAQLVPEKCWQGLFLQNRWRKAFILSCFQHSGYSSK